MKSLTLIVEELRETVGALEPERYAGGDAARLAEAAAEIVRLGETATAMLAHRAAETNAWRQVSHAASPEQWIAKISGSTETLARDALLTAGRVKTLPATEEKMRAGELSIAQATQVSLGAVADPSAEAELLRVARRSGLRALRAEKDRVVAAACDEERAHRMAHRERHLRTWTRGFATHGSFSGPNEEVAKILEALEPFQRQAFERARKDERRESHDAYRFDALVELATQAPSGGAKNPKPVVRVRVDAEALRRGHTEPGEVCEIPGLGPVPVAQARHVLGDGLLEVVITEGVDVRSVVSTTRNVPPALRIALEERDGACCTVRECDRTYETERHHTLPFAEHRLTTYDVLRDLCPEHHDLVTHHGYQLIDHGDGTCTLKAPTHTDAA